MAALDFLLLLPPLSSMPYALFSHFCLVIQTEVDVWMVVLACTQVHDPTTEVYIIIIDIRHSPPPPGHKY